MSKKYYCLNCDAKMSCIHANLISEVEVCLKEDDNDEL